MARTARTDSEGDAASGRAIRRTELSACVFIRQSSFSETVPNPSDEEAMLYHVDDSAPAGVTSAHAQLARAGASDAIKRRATSIAMNLAFRGRMAGHIRGIARGVSSRAREDMRSRACVLPIYSLATCNVEGVQLYAYKT